MRLSLIAARSENGVIGRDGDIPWHLPADLGHFKRLTTDHTIVMGRKTFASIGKPLPRRRSVVITRDAQYSPEGITVWRSAEEALAAAKAGHLSHPDDAEVFVIGGAEIYRAALPLADRMYLTMVHTRLDGDVRFPEFSPDEWHLDQSERHEPDDRNAYAYTFEIWNRVHH